jgi:hypothetical protein
VDGTTVELADREIFQADEGIDLPVENCVVADNETSAELMTSESSAPPNFTTAGTLDEVACNVVDSDSKS